MAVRKKKLTLVITGPPRLIVHFKTPYPRLRVHHIVRRQCLVADVSLIFSVNEYEPLCSSAFQQAMRSRDN